MIGMDSLASTSARGDRAGRIYGVVIGVVTNIEDDEHLGRVKVKFPWLSDSVESHWARMASPMAGAQRGVFFLPEVEDEVLVVFEHGLVSRPYILGALWNATDKPPVTSDADNKIRSITSKSGSVIEFTDDEKNGSKITIADKARKNTIVINAKENTMTITVEGDLSIAAKGNVALGTTDGDLKITCNNLTIDAKKAVSITAGADAKLEATTSVAIAGSQGVTINDPALKVLA